jgi:hypothetical protein
VRLDAAKGWVTSAGEADGYICASRPVSAEVPMTLWLVPGEVQPRHAQSAPDPCQMVTTLGP